LEEIDDLEKRIAAYGSTNNADSMENWVVKGGKKQLGESFAWKVMEKTIR
jgi:hypothetical protein